MAANHRPRRKPGHRPVSQTKSTSSKKRRKPPLWIQQILDMHLLGAGIPERALEHPEGAPAAAMEFSLRLKTQLEDANERVRKLQEELSGRRPPLSAEAMQAERAGCANAKRQGHEAARLLHRLQAMLEQARAVGLAVDENFWPPVIDEVRGVVEKGVAAARILDLMRDPQTWRRARELQLQQLEDEQRALVRAVAKAEALLVSVFLVSHVREGTEDTDLPELLVTRARKKPSKTPTPARREPEAH